ncbi:MAG: hypothetical protein HFJ12_06430 [Bacilli bacterium]|nr:hypothetical protein [Bacilli bacterium]
MENIRYRLYRELRGIFHPSISRENISNYQIVLQNDLLPVGVFYPKKDIPLDHIIIYVTGENNNIGKELALQTNHLVFVLENNQNNFFNQCYDMMKYLYHNIGKYDISKDHITVMSDSTIDILDEILLRSKETQDFYFQKEIYSNSNSEIKMDKNQLFIPDLNSKYSLNMRSQVFEMINQFLA